MNHAFIPSQSEPIKCSVCNYTESFHGENALCQGCPSIGPVELGRMNPNAPQMALCRDCIEKAAELERKLYNRPSHDPHGYGVTSQQMADANAYQSKELQDARLVEHKLRELENTVIRMARAIDSTIEVHTDLFNADTMSIIDIKKGIDEDEDIPADEKYDVLAEFLHARFMRHQELIFEKRKEIGQLGNEQKAIQQYMMTFANKVRAEVREKLKLSDKDYVPQAVLLDKVHKNRKSPNKVKFDKKLLAKEADDIRKEFPKLEGVEAMLQAMCIQKGIDVTKAAAEFRTMIKQGLSIARKD